MRRVTHRARASGIWHSGLVALSGLSLSVFALILAEYTRAPPAGTDEGWRGSGGHFSATSSP